MDRFAFEGNEVELVAKFTEFGVTKDEAYALIKGLDEFQSYLGDDECIEKIERKGRFAVKPPPRYHINISRLALEVISKLIGISLKDIAAELWDKEGEPCVVAEVKKVRHPVDDSLFDSIRGGDCLYKRFTVCRHSVNHKCTLSKNDLIKVLDNLKDKNVLGRQFNNYYIEKLGIVQ